MRANRNRKAALFCIAIVTVISCIFYVEIFSSVYRILSVVYTVPRISSEMSPYSQECGQAISLEKETKNHLNELNQKIHWSVFKSLGLIEPFSDYDNIYEQDPVFVTAWSEDHAIHGRRLLESFLHYEEFPVERKRMIVYDLEANKSISTMNLSSETYGNTIDIRKFNFSKYPDSVRNLCEYRWKTFAHRRSITRISDSLVDGRSSGLSQLQQ